MCFTFGFNNPDIDLKKYSLRTDTTVPKIGQVYPGKNIAIITAGKQTNELQVVQWGLVPPETDPKSVKKEARRLYNVRSESIDSKFKPSYSAPFLAGQRCLILADFFIEPNMDRSQTWRFNLPENEVFTIAGVWQRWVHPDDPGQQIVSCSMATTKPNAVVSQVHDRMPVILGPEVFDNWLTGEPKAAKKVLQPWAGDLMPTQLK